MTTRTVRVADLVGVPVAGLKAIITAPEHEYQYPQGVPVVTLTEVVIIQQRCGAHGPKVPWYRLRFTGHPSNCDFAGRSVQSDPDWSIRLVEGA